jgi:hypothetical protein
MDSVVAVLDAAAAAAVVARAGGTKAERDAATTGENASAIGLATATARARRSGSCRDFMAADLDGFDGVGENRRRRRSGALRRWKVVGSEIIG